MMSPRTRSGGTAAHHVEALQLAGAGVVGDVDDRAKLDHLSVSLRQALRRGLDDADEAPALALTAAGCWRSRRGRPREIFVLVMDVELAAFFMIFS